MSEASEKYVEIEPPLVKVIDSGVSGPDIVVMGGMHGDEPSPVKFLENILSEQEELRLDRGSVTCIIANPTAYKLGVRAVNLNLNAIMTTAEVEVGMQPEFASAGLLMDLLSKSDACIDLHEHKDRDIESIAIAPYALAPLATSLGTSMFIHGLETIEPGASDAYMAEIGKPGICVELGYHKDDNTAVARRVIRRFLILAGVVDAGVVPAPKPRIGRAEGLLIRKTNDFNYAAHVRSGMILPPGVYARDGSEEFFADGNELSVLFPRPKNPIGASVGILVAFEEGS